MRRSNGKSAAIGRESGFAYVWILLLVAMLGLGLSVGVEINSTITQRDKEKELLAIGRQFRHAIGRYYQLQLTNGQHVYPPSVDELIKDSRMPGIHRHLRKVFIDPMTGKAEWGTVQVNGRIVGIYSLSQKTPIKQDGFEVEEASFKGKQKLSEWVFTYPADLLLRGTSPNALLTSSFLSLHVSE